MSKQAVKRLLGTITLKSGRVLNVSLGTMTSFDTNTFKASSVLSFMDQDDKRRYILPGDVIESIEAREGTVLVDTPDTTDIT